MKTPSKIVVVDDNAETLETICLMIRSMNNAEVSGFTSAEELFETMGPEPDVDLIMCDWNMPDKTGLETLQEIRKDGNLTPFIMVTARNDLDSVLEARKFGVNLYISKPFSLNELHQKIRWVMNKNPLDTSNLAFSDDFAYGNT